MNAGKAIVAAAGIVLGSALASPALAQAMGGFYVGGSLGESDVKEFDCEGASSCDDSDTAWKAFAGFQFTPNLAIEAAYTDLGEVSARDTGISVRAEATAWEIVGVGSIPLANRFSIYGKAGLYRAETDARVRIAGLGSASEDESNNDLTFGFGVRFDLAGAVGLRAEWQRYSDVGGDLGESDIDILSAGVLVRF